MLRLSAFNQIPLRLLVLLSFLGYLLLALWFPLLPNYDLQPVGDIRTFAPDLVGGLLYGLLILALFTLHRLIFRHFTDQPPKSLKWILGVAFVFALPLLFIYPINANDVYRYVIRGLISSRYGLSPFEYAPADFGDELYPLLAGEWYNATSPYGPLWELAASMATAVGQDNLLLNILLFKILGLLALLGTGILLWRLLDLKLVTDAGDGRRRLAFVVLWTLNPALLLTFVGNAHNDALMILFLLLGWFVVRSGYRGPGFLLVLASALIKPIALLAAPVVFLSSWRELKDGRSRFVYLLWTAAGGAALVLISFLPFGSPASLFIRLLSEASAGASFSPLTLLILAAWELDVSISFSVVARLAVGIFLLFFLWILWRTWRGRSAEQGLAAVFWGYVFQALNFRIWYAVWPFPWLLLDGYGGNSKAVRLLAAGLWFLITSQLSVILYGHMRIALLGGSQFWAHLIGVPFVFLLPFVLAWILPPDVHLHQTKEL